MKRTARTIHRLRDIAKCSEAAKLAENHRRSENGQAPLMMEYRGKWRGRGTPGAFGKSRANRQAAIGRSEPRRENEHGKY